MTEWAEKMGYTKPEKEPNTTLETTKPKTEEKGDE